MFNVVTMLKVISLDLKPFKLQEHQTLNIKP